VLGRRSGPAEIEQGLIEASRPPLLTWRRPPQPLTAIDDEQQAARHREQKSQRTVQHRPVLLQRAGSRFAGGDRMLSLEPVAADPAAPFGPKGGVRL
jgi:hypothetical protein